MLGRVSHNMMSRALLEDVSSLSERIARAQRQISSGSQISAPSDDPLGTQRALGLRAAIEGAQQQQRNIGDATGWLETTDDALADASSIINRARELTIQGASDSLGPDQRKAIALEVDQLILALKETANASFQGTYIFSGTNTTSPPYAAATGDVYQGDAGVVARTIGPGVSVQINTRAVDLFGEGQGGADDKLLHVLQDISDHLKNPTPANAELLRTGDLKRLSDNLDALNQARATVGAVMSRLDSAATRLADVELTTTKLLSETEDTDLAKAILELNSHQTVYQAALRSGAQIIQPSLLDFLR
jgi:flagellar hook-associated protein 3 FlgL